MAITPLPWSNAINHIAEVQSLFDPKESRFCLLVRKDGGEERLEIIVPMSPAEVEQAWKGAAQPVTVASECYYGVYCQVRVLLQTPKGCVLWFVFHYQGPDGKTHSADSLRLLPGMQCDPASPEHLVPIEEAKAS